MKNPFVALVYVLGTITACALLLWFGGMIAAGAEAGLDTAKIEFITGLKGALNEKENTFRVSKPRDDVPITVEQAPMAPFMGLTAWAAFTPGMKDGAMMMGDIVLFEDEVNPVMSAALDNGLEVTALHNHFFFDKPKVCFMHIGGEGSVDKLAKGVRAVFDKETEIRKATSQPGRFFRCGDGSSQERG